MRHPRRPKRKRGAGAHGHDRLVRLLHAERKRRARAERRLRAWDNALGATIGMKA